MRMRWATLPLGLLVLCSPLCPALGAAAEHGGAAQRVAGTAPPRPEAAAAYPAGSRCPPTLDGHRIASTDGGSLFQGDPANRVQLAPGTSGEESRWPIGNPAGIVLVCRYDGLRRSLAYALPPGVTMCRQRAGAPLTCN